MLEVGTKAPAFTLPDKDGNLVSLSDFLGKKVVLYFYPRDNTPGCTRQAVAFAERFGAFEEKNAVVWSPQSALSPVSSGRRRTARSAWAWCAVPI